VVPPNSINTWTCATCQLPIPSTEHAPPEEAPSMMCRLHIAFSPPNSITTWTRVTCQLPIPSTEDVLPQEAHP
jgi:hypothetical protein